MKALLFKGLLQGLLMVLSCTAMLQAQAPNFIKLEEYIYGGIRKDMHYGYWPAIYLLPDKGYYILSVSESDVSGNKTEPNCMGVDGIVWADAWLLRCDSLGNIIWQQTYGGPNAGDELILLHIENDGDLFLAGNSQSDAGCEKGQNAWGTANNSDFWVICVDAQGNKKWDRRYGSGAIEFLKGALPTDDGGYLLYGSSFGSTMQDVTDTSNGADECWLLKIDSNGVKQWNKLIGGSSYDFVNRIFRSGINEYTLLAGSYTGAPSGDWIFQNYTGLGSPDSWLIRTDTMGNIISQSHYGGMGDDLMFSGMIDSYGHLVVLAFLKKNAKGGTIADSVSRGFGDCWIFILDSAGNILNQKRFGGNLHNAVHQIYQTSDGGYFVSGRSDSPASFEKSENSKGGYDVWLLKLDSALNIVWDKTIGGNRDEWEPSFAMVNDSVFYLCVHSGSDISGDKGIASFDTIQASMTNRADMWVTKWLMSYTTATSVEDINQDDFIVYPNPASTSVTLRFKQALPPGHTSLEVTDITGRTLESRSLPYGTQTYTMNVSHYAPGIYLIRAGTVTGKLVKQ